MFAIVEAGGKQHRVEAGQEFKVAKINLDPGCEVVLDKVLMVSSQEVSIGAPYLPSAKVVCELLGHGRGRKIIVMHKRRRHDSRKTQGHRQDYSTLRVKDITAV